MVRLPLLLSTLLSAACQVQAKGVFAHFMLANSVNYTTDDWREDINAAKAAHIDAFALNSGFQVKGLSHLLDDAFKAADDLDFKLFLSLDYSGSGSWPQDKVVSFLKNYTTQPAYYKHQGKLPLVSSFEGAQSAGDWKNIKKKVKCFFIPDYSSSDPKKVAGHDGIDGLFNWNSWPDGSSDMNTTLDHAYLDALKGKPYIMGVSPWFYTNLVQYHKNWVWQGDDLWYTRWQQVLDLNPEYVEIISWNDYPESHYIGPLHANSLDIFRSGGAPFNYALNMPHDGWRALLPYVIDLFKNNGRDTATRIDNEALVAWYRLNPATACKAGKTTGNSEMQGQQTMPPGEILQDKIFFSALLESPADVSVSIGGHNRSVDWASTPPGESQGKGIYHGNVPMDDRTGEVVVTLSRDHDLVAQMIGQPITTQCDRNLTNWNAWVGNATASGRRAQNDDTGPHGSRSRGGEKSGAVGSVVWSRCLAGLIQFVVLWCVYDSVLG